MKITEASNRAYTSAANAASKGLPYGLQYGRSPKGHYVALVWRVNGHAITIMDELSAGEAAAALRMFRAMVEAIKHDNPF